MMQSTASSSRKALALFTIIHYHFSMTLYPPFLDYQFPIDMTINQFFHSRASLGYWSPVLYSSLFATVIHFHDMSCYWISLSFVQLVVDSEQRALTVFAQTITPFIHFLTCNPIYIDWLSFHPYYDIQSIHFLSFISHFRSSFHLHIRHSIHSFLDSLLHHHKHTVSNDYQFHQSLCTFSHLWISILTHLMTINLTFFPISFPKSFLFLLFYFLLTFSSLLISPISYISFAFVGYCLLLTFDCSTLILHPFLDIQSIHLTCICEPCLHSLYEAEKKNINKKKSLLLLSFLFIPLPENSNNKSSITTTNKGKYLHTYILIIVSIQVIL